MAGKEPGQLARKAEQLLASQGAFRAVIDQMCNWLYIVDGKDRMMYGGERRANGGSANELLEMEAYIKRILPEHQGRVRQSMELMIQGGTSTPVEYQLADNMGAGQWFEAQGIALPLEESEDSLYAWMVKEITKRKLFEEELLRMAFHDPLTELPNRRLFHVSLSQSLAYAKRNKQLLAILSLDIDDFKMINDSFGHEMGDEFLKAFAKRVKRCVREVDMFARMGGDEFSILLPKIDSVGSVQIVTERILQAIRQGWEVKSHRLNSTVSMGVAVYPNDGTDAETLLRNVDAALYRVKVGGRNGYSFYNSVS
jgi:diguanylate cyclase (GGDEF)-like protein/PAS domain S-box-containing protein